ncbi:MAG: PilC/PilY family type IV pilus protein, partial [Candidatus Competibacteraceae bacterium]|nr:PilC/PilY family type IV pilus protein [Candidatus Competibacteraceae bacterium]
MSDRAFRIIAALAVVLFLVPAFGADPFVPGPQPTGWMARPTLTDADLSSGSERYFRGTYRMSSWNGDIQAHPVGADGVVQATDFSHSWSAASLLDAQHYDTDRKIVTLNGATGVPFRWASLAADQRSALGSEAILNYVRGDRSNEAPNGARWRVRRGVLGDIIHSTLYYWRHQGGVERLYVGANDGMLHVLDAQTGQEVFAYVPSMLLPNLDLLTENPYEHTAFVDGPLTMARVNLAGGTRTILVGALGAGGRGLFALDVTDPSPASEAAAAGKILWEITASGDFANLGYSYGTPRIARLNNGAAAVIVGNGYLNQGSGRSTLLVVDLATGARIAEIDTLSGNSSSPAGLSTPTLVDSDGNGTADYAYAGDIDGKLWKFDLTGFTATRLYTTSPAQAITVAPVVRSHPQGGYMVAFATGRILTDADLTDGSIHYVYGIWDGAPSANSTLLIQTLSETSFAGERMRTVTADLPQWEHGGHRGWQVALP